MGSFIGHVVPGSFFLTFAIWWLFNTLDRYFRSQRFKPHSYRNSSNFPCPCNHNIPIESIFKVVASVVGMIGEFCTAFENGKFTHWGNAQHMTMFFFFGINGAVDLLIHRGWPLPKKLDYVTAVLAFSVEGFLFYNHLHGRTHMDIQVHMFLFYVTVSCVVSTIFEMFQPTNVMPALCRIFFTLLQGSWFYQVGFILYPPFGEKWDEGDHTQMMMVTMIFTWHLAGIFFLMMAIGLLVYLRVQNGSGSSLPIYQMVDTNEKDEFEGDTNINNSPNNTKGKGLLLNNGHHNSNNHHHNHHESLQRILDSDSEAV